MQPPDDDSVDEATEDRVPRSPWSRRMPTSVVGLAVGIVVCVVVIAVCLALLATAVGLLTGP